MNPYYIEHVRLTRPSDELKSHGTFEHRQVGVVKVWAQSASKAIDRARSYFQPRPTFEYLRCSQKPPHVVVCGEGVVELSLVHS